MAFDAVDAYEFVSDGLYAGSVREADVGFTAVERMTRLISHGFLDDAPETEAPTGENRGGLNDVGTRIRL